MFVQVLRRLQEHGIKLKKHQSASSSSIELDTWVGLFSAMASPGDTAAVHNLAFETETGNSR